MVVTKQERNSNPYYVLFEEDSNEFLQKSKEGNFTRRQDCPTVYELNGAVYIFTVKEDGMPVSALEAHKKVK